MVLKKNPRKIPQKKSFTSHTKLSEGCPNGDAENQELKENNPKVKLQSSVKMECIRLKNRKTLNHLMI